MVFVFGFLPWSEVSCNSKEVEFRITQSGYQAVYGGVSVPPAMEAVVRRESEKQAKAQPTIQQNKDLGKQLGVERAYLANVSPFLVVFWGANLAILVIGLAVPLGAWRMRFALGLSGLMLGALIVHASLGLPIERRIGEAIADAVQEDGSLAVLVLAFKTGKTAWFWLTLVAVSLMAATEGLVSWLWAEPRSGWIVPGAITGAGTALVIIGLVIQLVGRGSIVSGIEGRMAAVRQAEDHDRRKREDEQHIATAKQQAEAERLRRLAELKRQEIELQRQETERLAQEARVVQAKRQAERDAWLREQAEARAKADAERKAQLAREEEARKAEDARRMKEEARLAREDAERKTKLAAAEAGREAARKAELERKGLPYYPRPLTLHDGGNAQEWYQLLVDRPIDARAWRQATEALVALKAESMPFLLDYMGRCTTPKDRETALRLVRVEYIHPNDLRQLFLCLDDGKVFPSTRLRALGYLQTRAKDLKKELVPEIEGLVGDMLRNSRYKEETKQEVSGMLDRIRREAH
jgi:hypothetical protein